MADYSAIDPILIAWAHKRVVHVYTRHQDCDVRTVMIADPSGRQRQLAVDPIDDSGRVGIHAGRFDGWRLDRFASLAELEHALDEVYDAMMGPGGAAPVSMLITNYTGGSPVKEIKTFQMRFWREQDGPRERVLRGQLSAFFEKEPNVRSAYLALMDHGEHTPPGVAVCLDAQVADDRTLVEKIEMIFRSLFERNEQMDILFLAGDQKENLETICPPFYRRGKPI
jgi:SseB protein C-terminal domain